uniref:Deoxyribonuclease-2-alpha n=1 Tax=Neogobius melanostomus TaxID=47308 RepID=A0A8C6TUC2_9GOBI
NFSECIVGNVECIFSLWTLGHSLSSLCLVFSRFILYKAPKGQRYMYISTYGKEKINTNIGDPHGVLANTLSPMFDNNMPQSFGFLSYNDQPPVSKTSDFENLKSGVYGHSKGVVLGDSQTQTALWLTHSTPRFPEKRDQQNFWPKTGEANGQTFMCVTLQFSDLEVIGKTGPQSERRTQGYQRKCNIKTFKARHGR